MAAKRIRVSNDAGSSYHTLPGSTGELRNEANELNDTIFGQSFSSSEVGLIAGMIDSNSFYKGFAGYHADIQQMAGVTTSFTAEATTLVSGKTYRITDATKDVWDYTQAITVLDGAADVTDEVESIDFLFGIFTFNASFTPADTITVEGEFFPKVTVANGRSFNLTMTQEPIDDTDYETAQANDGRNTFQYGLKTVALEIGGVFASSNGWLTALQGRSDVIIEIAPVGSEGDDSRARGIFRVNRQSQSGDVGNLEEETVNFTLKVPQQSDVPTVGFDEELLLTPFRWNHPAGTNLATAVQICLNAWEEETTLLAQYLDDGVNGQEADALVSEISITGGLEAMNEFSVGLQLSGALSTVP
jgi:hypothetical protein